MDDLSADKEQLEETVKEKTKEIRNMMAVHTENSLDNQNKLKKMKASHEEQCRELMNSLEKVTIRRWFHFACIKLLFHNCKFPRKNTNIKKATKHS